MKVQSNQDLKDHIERLEREARAWEATVENLTFQKNEIHQNVMDVIWKNRTLFITADACSDVAHQVGNAIRGIGPGLEALLAISSETPGEDEVTG